MSTKKPLVLGSDGLIEQLQPTDTILGFNFIEVDFGIIPVSSMSFTVNDPNVLPGSNILVLTDYNSATGRLGNDWELDMPFFSTVPDTGFFTLVINFNHSVVGKRKLKYTIL